MVVPTPGPPPIVNAPPVSKTPPVPIAAPAAPQIHVTPSESKPRSFAVAPRHELTDKQKAAASLRANLLMLVVGVIVLTITMLVLLNLTDRGPAP